MKPLLVSSGEPAGIGPDLCLELANLEVPLVILGDQSILEERADILNKKIKFITYQPDIPITTRQGNLTVLNLSCPEPVIPGQLNVKNAPYVYELLTMAAALCASKEFSALITAPVHKGIINDAGISFTGHTEFLAEFFHSEQVVMMLACPIMRVALVTTHLPLKDVAGSITKDLVVRVIAQVHSSLRKDFNIQDPRIKVAGLNPHAGESGHLGLEEIEVICPAIEELQSLNMNVQGPYPADTLFTASHMQSTDVFIAMYHDQGLPVLKYAGFHDAVNITLGLPIIRTSVDHGTALELAGKGLADPGSLLEAVKIAMMMAMNWE